MDENEKTYNPVEQYLKNLMDSDKPEKRPEAVAVPAARIINLKGVKNQQPIAKTTQNSFGAERVSEVLRQSIDRNKKPTKKSKSDVENQTTWTADTRRHPIGLLIVLISAVIIYACSFSFISFMLPGFADLLNSDLNIVGPVVGILMIILALVGVVAFLFAVRHYWANRLLLSRTSLTHTYPHHFLESETTETALTDIENIVWRRQGRLSRFFDYGLLTIQTYDGNKDVIFRYAPGPGAYAKAIQDAKLKYMAEYQVSHP